MGKHESFHVNVDDQFLDHFGPLLGARGISVYLVLARFADKETRKSTVQYREIARSLGLGKSTIRRAVHSLIRCHLIEREADQACGELRYFLRDRPQDYKFDVVRQLVIPEQSRVMGDPNRCWFCGCEFVDRRDGERLAPNSRTEDHLTPRSRGGIDIGNLVYACFSCNCLRKRVQTLEEYRKSVFPFYGEKAGDVIE
jgi:predicted DNA-binding transcriptional regulator